MKSRYWFIVVVFTAGCESSGIRLDPVADPARVQTALGAQLAWFTCEECNEGELAELARYGNAVVPSLGMALQQGPPTVLLKTRRDGLAQSYDQMARWAENNERAMPQSKSEFVSVHMENYIKSYRARARIALLEIGTRRARNAVQGYEATE